MKTVFAFSTILVASLGLAACGGDDSSYDTVSPTEIQFSTVSFSHNNGLRYSERSDVVLRDGQIQTTSKVFEGVNNSPAFSFPYTYIAANYYRTFDATKQEFNAIISPTLKVLTPTSYSYTLNSATNNQSLTFTPALKSYDISGITTADTERFFTPLSLYNLNNAQFPANSICYADVIEKVSSPVFKLGYAFLNQKTLEEWLDTANAANSNNYDYEIVKVGENNEYRAIRLVDPSNYKGDIGYEAAVEMDGSVYTADYIFNGYSRYIGPDTDSVYCNHFNDIAADYLETQILADS